MNLLINVFLSLLISAYAAKTKVDNSLIGAWKGENAILIIADGYFSYAGFSPNEFQFTYAGSCSSGNSGLKMEYEYHTSETNMVGQSATLSYKLEGAHLILGDQHFSRLDDGQPGKLSGAWLFFNRVKDGKPGTPRYADNPRKTMKILSGTRFQWIAYNDSTKTFHGTGGGTYSTENGKYVENIDFFSRDNSRVGASLEFDFEIKGDDWHHRGFSSKGDPIYEIWKMRQ